MRPLEGDAVTADFESLFEQMIAQQRGKVLAVARTINPRLTEDDILSPQDFPELIEDSRFNYEDGLLAGLISAQIALRALTRERLG
ncbi:MAG TPA: hypothetical protein VFE84_04140 [Patescibacteria group bacterium]|nr:hypothetical protein [Patescibacteria group bacterium]